MKKVTAFIGSARKKNTYKAVEQFMNNLQKLGDVEYEIILLSHYNLGICRGCQLCFMKGEAFCPLKDDRDVLFDKIHLSDGVVFAAPNYTWDLSGMMKVFLDRFGFIVHRPRYFGKVFTSIVAQAMGRGEKIVETFDFTAKTLGFNTLKGITITAFDSRTEKQQQKIDRDLSNHSQRFYTLLTKPAYPVPTLFQLSMFKISRNAIKHEANPVSIDYRYYSDKGWLESEYYYPTHLSPLKKVAGYLFESMAVTLRNIML
jgi:multimeric flavodoxin WrbA